MFSLPSQYIVWKIKASAPYTAPRDVPSMHCSAVRSKRCPVKPQHSERNFPTSTYTYLFSMYLFSSAIKHARPNHVGPTPRLYTEKSPRGHRGLVHTRKKASLAVPVQEHGRPAAITPWTRKAHHSLFSDFKTVEFFCSLVQNCTTKHTSVTHVHTLNDTPGRAQARPAARCSQHAITFSPATTNEDNTHPFSDQSVVLTLVANLGGLSFLFMIITRAAVTFLFSLAINSLQFLWASMYINITKAHLEIARETILKSY